jgi:Zn-finger nucleic acid-binding protein
MGTPDPRNAVRCSACTALVSAGASFCPQCGDPLAAADEGQAALACPACPGQTMASWRLQPTSRQPYGHAVHGCRRCGGVWVDRDTLDVMIASAAEQGAGDGRAPGVHRRELSMASKVVYRPCSVCGHTMSRRNFARISGVIVDECRMHGTFFDAGELEDILTFVRSGGLLLSRRRETEELAREQRRIEAQTPTQHPMMAEAHPGLATGMLGDELDLGVAFVRWAGRWVRNMFR